MTSFNPIFTYSTYIPQQTDIENNVKNSIISDFQQLKGEFEQLKGEFEKLMDRMKKLEQNFENTIAIRFVDGIIGTVLIIIIYVKVYT
jgi:hypothetical protein